MGNNDLKILITGTLNTGKSIGEINTAIRGIQQKIKPLKLNVEINDNVMKIMKQFSEQMKKIQGEAGKRIEEVLLPDGTKVKTTSFDNLSKSLEDLTVKASENAKTAESLAQQTVGAQQKINQNMTKNLQLNRESISEKKNGLSLLKQEYSDNKNIHKLTVERDQTGKTISARYVSDHQKAKQLTNEEEKQTEELKHQLSLFKQKQALQVQDLKHRYKDVIDGNALDAHLGKVNALGISKDTPHLMKEAALGLKQIEINAKQAGSALGKAHSHSISLTEAFQTAMVKFPINPIIYVGIKLL